MEQLRMLCAGSDVQATVYLNGQPVVTGTVSMLGGADAPCSLQIHRPQAVTKTALAKVRHALIASLGDTSAVDSAFSSVLEAYAA